MSLKYFWAIALGVLSVYLLNLFIDIIDVDAAQYAAISMEMAQNNSFLEVYMRGADYLDKPPMLFWLASLSFKIFGYHNWSYKLPALLLILSGIYATYRFAKLYYEKRTALLAALIASCSQAFFMMTNDVRTEGVFTGFVMLSFWQMAAYFAHKRRIFFILSALFISCAMMTKGPLALIIFASGWGLHFISRREWKKLFSPSWLLFLLIVCVLLLPMCYGLFVQFDLHPEKTVYNLSGPSGLKFFFWTQSFGRITGGLYWDNGLPWHFFLTSVLWDFQPWITFIYTAFFFKIKNFLFRAPMKEYVSLGAFVLPFIALSLSRYKLPHYVFPLLPFAAIVTSEFLTEQFDRLRFKKSILRVQWLFLGAFLLAPLISFIFFFTPDVLTLLFWLFFLAIIAYVLLKGNRPTITLSFVIAIAFNFVMAGYFYRNLLPYQSETVAAKYVNNNKPADVPFYWHCTFWHSLDFYRHRITPELSIQTIKQLREKIWVYTDEAGKIELENMAGAGLKVKEIKAFKDFHISALSIPFLMKASRDKACQNAYILEIKR